ncbi:hypothetical protein D9758_007363 [Tetrapyrgos nigripes]|uniref:Transmembrane protein n=1 Tax=Tetrapyrgos nigripes TaxID=182062 RepID=A0A8H5GBG1_9AGAR|nr:hypothetical protein D9758_007363 [Tetrapyrgos nigripes]
MHSTSSNMSFHLDGAFVGQRSPIASTSSSEKQIVFANTSLSMTQHSLVIQNGDPAHNLIIVTYQDQPTSSSKPQAGVIVGSVLGSLAVIPLVGLGYLLYIRRSQQSADAESPTSDSEHSEAAKSMEAPSLSLLSTARPVRTHQAAGSFQIDASSRGHTGPPAPNYMSESQIPPSSPWFVEPSQGINRVHRWQQETHDATRDIAPMAPPDMSEELSSYYDDNATESQRYRPVTPPPPARRFVVRNN